VHVGIGALRSNDLPKVAWLYEEMECKLPADCTAHAAVGTGSGGSVELLKWLKQKGWGFDEQTSMGAPCSPHNIPLLQFLLNELEGCPWNQNVCSCSAGTGDLEQVQWLHQHGAVLGADTASRAAGSDCNAVPLLTGLLQQPGIQLDAAVMTAAAEAGNLEVCEWLHSAGCAADESACAAAANSGSSARSASCASMGAQRASSLGATRCRAHRSSACCSICKSIER
jgi:hypothetical protein